MNTTMSAVSEADCEYRNIYKLFYLLPVPFIPQIFRVNTSPSEKSGRVHIHCKYERCC